MSDTWTREVGLQVAVDRGQRAIEQHMLDAHMIVEIFDVTNRARGATWMGVNRWTAMCR